MINPDDKHEIAGHQVLQTTVRECTHWSLPETVQPSLRQQMLVVRWCRQDGGRDSGTPLPPLQPVETPAVSTEQRGVKGNGMESGQMPTRADL